MRSIKVAAAIIEREGRILATQRGYGSYKDWWEFPGGKLEQGESPEEALVREIREELDTEIEVGDLLTIVEYDYPEFHMTMSCFMCRMISGRLTLIEHEAARWLSADELWDVKWLPSDIRVIEELETLLRKENGRI